MALKSLLFVSLLVGAVIFPLAEAQSLNVSVILVQGILYCTANGSIGVNGIPTPVFPNAEVQLKLGNGSVLANVTTGLVGQISMLLPAQSGLPALLQTNGTLVVNTPLARCNASLPATGILRSALQFVGNTTQDLLTIINFVPRRFELFIRT